MVKISSDVKSAVSAAVTKAEKRTSAEIAVVITPASDGYQSFTLVYGFAAGGLAAALLWGTKTLTAFPLLLVIQAAVMASFALLPPLRHLCMKLMPVRVLHHAAARRAAEEFLALSHRVPPERPVVLLYVSLAERYAHIHHTRAAGAQIPRSTWDAIVRGFAGGVKKPGLAPSCEMALAKIADALEPHFPEGGEPNILSDSVK
jgi:putative membrane protein